MQRAKWTDEEDELDEKIYITLCEDIGQGGKKKKNLTWLPSIFVGHHQFRFTVSRGG